MPEKAQGSSLDVFFSPDGTNIEYTAVGSGPRILLLHGSKAYPQERDSLSRILSKHFTVYCPDRRGWANSGGLGQDYCMEKECEDAIGLMRENRIDQILALDSGCLVALHTMLRFPCRRAVLIEPCLASLADLSWMARAAGEQRDGKPIDAFITCCRHMEKGMNLLPRCVLRHFFLRSPTVQKNLERFDSYLRIAPQEFCAAFEAEPELRRMGSISSDVLTITNWDADEAVRRSAQLIASEIPGGRSAVVDLENTCPKNGRAGLSDFLNAVLTFLGEGQECERTGD